MPLVVCMCLHLLACIRGAVMSAALAVAHPLGPYAAWRRAAGTPHIQLILLSPVGSCCCPACTARARWPHAATCPPCRLRSLQLLWHVGEGASASLHTQAALPHPANHTATSTPLPAATFPTSAPSTAAPTLLSCAPPRCEPWALLPPSCCCVASSVVRGPCLAPSAGHLREAGAVHWPCATACSRTAAALRYGPPLPTTAARACPLPPPPLGTPLKLQVRKLLPESWGFLCPVHTPDGSPCGLLNHLTATCRCVGEHASGVAAHGCCGLGGSGHAL